ncbi:hypothetical protein Hanom_Chr13g01202161 [Helianthus anomalus]
MYNCVSLYVSFGSVVMDIMINPHCKHDGITEIEKVEAVGATNEQTMQVEDEVVSITQLQQIEKDEHVVIATDEPESYILFGDQDFEKIWPYFPEQKAPEERFEYLKKYYDPEVLKYAWDYSLKDEEDDWYFNPYEGEHGSDSDSDLSCLDDCHWK